MNKDYFVDEKHPLNQVITKDHYQEYILLNDDFFTFLLKDIQKSAFTIDLSTYIFTNDTLSQTIAAELIKAARRGVKVRLLIDGIGGRYCDEAQILSLEKAGVLVHFYHPLPWVIWQCDRSPKPHAFFLTRFFYFLSKMNRRNHSKLCIIDHHVVYISSANIDKSHLSKMEGGDGWRDSTVRIVGVDVSLLQEAFDLAWNDVRISRLVKKRLNRSEYFSIFNLNITRFQRKRNYRNLVAHFNDSKKRVWVTNPYFVPDSYILNSLTRAAKRGVDIRILLPRDSDVPISTLVANTFYSALLKKGVRIYEYTKSILHAKIIIVDDWFVVGSSNLNTRSLKHDLEVDVCITTLEAKKILEQQFLLDLENSQQINMTDLKKQSIFKTIIGHLLLSFRYWI